MTIRAYRLQQKPDLGVQKKNTTVAAEATYMQLLTINMFVPELCCVWPGVEKIIKDREW